MAYGNVIERKLSEREAKALIAGSKPLRQQLVDWIEEAKELVKTHSEGYLVIKITMDPKL